MDVKYLVFAATCLLASVCIVLAGLYRRRRSSDQVVADLRIRVSELSEQVQVCEVVIQNQARRVERLGWELAQLQDTRRAPLAPVSVVSESSERIHQAIKLARRGESVESLMSLCALGRGEAELLVKLHYRPEVSEENGDLA